MSVKIGEYTFEGPYDSAEKLDNRSGVYAVLDSRQDGLHVLDVGESANVKDRVTNHDRKESWTRNKKGKLKVAVHYTPNAQQTGRKQVEQALRAKYKPPCGDK